MKSTIIKTILSIKLVLVCALVFNLAVSAAGNAKISFSELTHDFGKVKQGEKLEHVFKFTNEGDGTLIITSVQPSCGCTGVIMNDKKEFNAGEEGEIKITFNTEGRQGVNSKTVIVNTNDLENPVITLTFKCEIETE